MIMKYKIILIDLDNTLLDFYDAEKVAFTLTCEKFNLPYSEENYKKYNAINDSWWKIYEKGLATKEDIVINRFVDFLSYVNVKGSAKEINEFYRLSLANGTKSMPGAYELLEFLHSKGCKIFIATNGYHKIQYKRIGVQPFKKFIDDIFISDELGYPKPYVEFFKKAEEKCGLKFSNDTLIIGDSLSSDIQGGINIGIDTLLVNFSGKNDLPVKPTYIVNNLFEIIKLFS